MKDEIYKDDKRDVDEENEEDEEDEKAGAGEKDYIRR